jgi:hypothetical protein
MVPIVVFKILPRISLLEAVLKITCLTACQAGHKDSKAQSSTKKRLGTLVQLRVFVTPWQKKELLKQFLRRKEITNIE